MTARWLDMMHDSPDASVGQMLLRLAHLAEAAHRQAAADAMVAGAAAACSHDDESRQDEGLDRLTVAHQPRTDATGAAMATPRAVHTEVNR